MTESDGNDQKKKGKTLLLAVAGVIVGGAIASGIIVLHQSNQSGGSVLTDMDAYLKSQSATAMSDEMKALFPDEYRKIRADIAGEAREGDTAIAAQSNELSNRFFKAHVEDMRKAPDDALVAIVQANKDLLIYLRNDYIPQCAQYGMTGSLGTDLFGRTLSLVSALGAAQVRAARAGIDAPVVRVGLSEAEQMSFQAAIAAEIKEPVLTLIFTDRLGGASEAEQCNGSLAIYGALLRLPKESAAKIMAGILGRAQR